MNKVFYIRNAFINRYIVFQILYSNITPSSIGYVFKSNHTILENIIYK